MCFHVLDDKGIYIKAQGQNTKMKTKAAKFERWKLDEWFSKYKNLHQEPVEAVKQLGEPWNVKGFDNIYYIGSRSKRGTKNSRLRTCFKSSYTLSSHQHTHTHTPLVWSKWTLGEPFSGKGKWGFSGLRDPWRLEYHIKNPEIKFKNVLFPYITSRSTFQVRYEKNVLLLTLQSKRKDVKTETSQVIQWKYPEKLLHGEVSN